ncbi:MAG: glutaredoxin family protein [Anaerolineae bacterium]|nr:glutaredoxin family protein [Anaerolineae bacterium]
MTETKEIVVYSRTSFCPYISKAHRVFEQYGVSYREIMIDQDQEAARRVEAWTGFLSVPTIIVARPGEDLPYEDPVPLPPGASPRGVDRGSMITEAGEAELTNWLKRNGFIDK